jgi:hypothetical protein
LFRAGDFFEDVCGLCGPDEGLWIGVVLLQVAFDCGFKVVDAVKDAAADGFVGDQAEEAFDLIEPRGRSRREMPMGLPLL